MINIISQEKRAVNEFLVKTCAKIVAENPDMFKYGMPMI